MPGPGAAEAHTEAAAAEARHEKEAAGAGDDPYRPEPPSEPPQSLHSCWCLSSLYHLQVILTQVELIHHQLKWGD